MFNVPDPATEAYLAALQASDGERHILGYFKKHPALIYRHTVPCRGHDDYIMAEFPAFPDWLRQGASTVRP